MREIEIKLKVNNLDELKQKLISSGCILSEPINQRDLIYSKKGSTEEWTKGKTGHTVMRIRRQDKDAVFNLKQQLSSELDNLEYESKVSDPDAIHKILSILGYEPQVEVKKVRQKGKVGNYEICLDVVEKLGSFVELEKLTDDSVDVDAVRNELFETLESYGLSRKDEVTLGYDTQIYNLQNIK